VLHNYERGDWPPCCISCFNEPCPGPQDCIIVEEWTKKHGENPWYDTVEERDE
jgi:hypothetical protein